MIIQIITIEGERDEVTGVLRDFDPEEFRVKVRDSVKGIIKASEPSTKEWADMIDGRNVIDPQGVQMQTEQLRPGIFIPPFPPLQPVTTRDKTCSICSNPFHDNSSNNNAKKCDVCRFPVGNNKDLSVVRPPRLTRRGFGVTGMMKVCRECGKEFEPRSNAQVRCSEACGMKPKPKPVKEVPGVENEEKRKYTKKQEPVKVKPTPSAVKPFIHKKNVEPVLPKSKVKVDLTQNGEIKPPANNRPPVILKQNEHRCANPQCNNIFKLEKLNQKYCAECGKMEKVKEREMEMV